MKPSLFFVQYALVSGVQAWPMVNYIRFPDVYSKETKLRSMSTPPSLKADRVPEDDIVLVWTASRHKAALLHPTSGTLRPSLVGAFRRAGRDAAVLPPLEQ